MTVEMELGPMALAAVGPSVAEMQAFLDEYGPSLQIALREVPKAGTDDEILKDGDYIDFGPLSGGFNTPGGVDDGTWSFGLDASLRGLSSGTLGFGVPRDLSDLLEEWGRVLQSFLFGDEIVIVGNMPPGIDLGSGLTLYRFNDGVMSLYVDGEWFSNVEVEDFTITNNSPSGSVTFNSNGGGFSYSANDSMTYNLIFLPGGP